MPYVYSELLDESGVQCLFDCDPILSNRQNLMQIASNILKTCVDNISFVSEEILDDNRTRYEYCSQFGSIYLILINRFWI